MRASIESWLRECVGRRMDQVLGEYYIGQDSSAAGPLSIWVAFSGLEAVRIFGRSDGWAIGIDLSSPAEKDLGPLGRTVILDVSSANPFSCCIGDLLRGAAVLASPGSPDPVGVRLFFCAGGSVSIVNWGDELYCGPDLPPDSSPSDFIAMPV